MKPLLPICVAALVSSSLVARTWTSSDGRELEAEFVSATEMEVTVKRDADGKELTIPLNKLSEEDQKFASEQEPAAAEVAEAQPIAGKYAELITGDWKLAEHGKLPYAFYGAKDLDGAKKYPLVISLHGKSDDNTNGLQIGFSRKFSEPSNYTERPCLILAPLCYQPYGSTGGGWNDDPGDETIDLIKDLLKELPMIDEDRVYVIGYSMGGFGTWRFLTEELKRSKVFKYTEFPEGGHGIIGEVVDDPKLHEWIFAQKR